MSFLYVKVYYGPCNTHNSCVFKPQLLRGIHDRLQKVGFRVDLLPVDFENYCMFAMCGHEVFRCNLKHLKFNSEYKRDIVCRHAVEAVIGAATKFRRARAYLWFWTLMDHQLFRRSPHAPKDFWPVDVDLDSIPTCADCAECCFKRNEIEER